MSNEQKAAPHFLTTIGALAERGGRVTKAGIAGDLIRHVDHSAARIMSGLGPADYGEFAAPAFVCSELDNGDTMTNSPECEG